MKLRNIILVFFGLFGVIQGCSNKAQMVRTGAFYDMPVRFIRTEPGGRDYFLVFGKGKDEKACREQAKSKLILDLIYKGVQKGSGINAILNDPASITNFKMVETNFIEGIITDPAVIKAGRSASNKILQSKERGALYNMSFEIGIDRAMLRGGVLKTLEINKL